MSALRLTQMTRKSGCGCKLGPDQLTDILNPVSAVPPDARVLVGSETHDDAGVFLLNAATALVQTIDFFTPIVDDPYQFGAIAATNALSDVWAMGGTPLTALNVLAIPADSLPLSVVGLILAGGGSVMNHFGVSLLGGHSVDDTEPKVGYAVTGLVDPDHVWKNSTAQPGDRLYCTKPIGTGVVVKAIKDQRAESSWQDAAIAMMLEANQAAHAVLQAIGGPTSCTDITGFGLLGHLWEMATAAGVSIEVYANQVPCLPGSEDLAREGAFPGGSRANAAYVAPHLTSRGVAPHRVALLADAVTSGGLLFTVDPGRSAAVEQAFSDRGVSLWPIGTVGSGPAALTVSAHA
jgi:selenide,water dikinase